MKIDGRLIGPYTRMAGRKTVKGMATISKWFKNVWRGPWIADLPPELAECEDGCSVTECSHGKWLTCEYRIRRVRDEILFSHPPRQSEVGDGGGPKRV